MLLSRLQDQHHAYEAHRRLLQLAPGAVLVGGAVRDLVLGQPVKDLDYALAGNGAAAARSLADALGAAYYPLHEEHGIGRVVWAYTQDTTLVVDVASLAGDDLDADLLDRDFTINAMALLPSGDLYDPLGGQSDLAQRRLRTCSPQSLLADPVRVLRGVRMLFAFQLHPAPGLDALVREAAASMDAVSPERQRDELLALLMLPEPHFAVMHLRVWRLESQFFPELAALPGIEQPPPHVYDVYEHTLAALRWSARLDRLLRGEATPSGALEELMAAALSPYAPALAVYLQTPLSHHRPLWLWLRFSALAHDWGKPATRRLDAQGTPRFLGHESLSAYLAAAWLHRFNCATREIQFVRAVCAGHMRPLNLAPPRQPPTRRALYHLYRDLENATPAVLLLALADHLATAVGADGIRPGDQRMELAPFLDFIVLLLAAGLGEQQAPVAPKPLLSGHDLMTLFGLKPGPGLGALLKQLREAQAVGEVVTRQDAITFVRGQLRADDV